MHHVHHTVLARRQDGRGLGDQRGDGRAVDRGEANATAKTAFGCRNGLATDPAWLLISCPLSGVWFVGIWGRG